MNAWRDPVSWWDGLDRPLRHTPRPFAAGLLAFVLAFMAYCAVVMLPSAAPEAPPEPEETQLEEGEGDIALYERISDRVVAGENYYAAALAEQRANNYPARPFVTVRQPTLAMAHRWFGVEIVGYALIAALVALILLLFRRIEGETRLAERIGAALAVLLGGIGLTIPQAPLIHEVVAGTCLSLALVLYSPQRWWPALLFAGLALAVRELVLPFVLLWFAFALSQRRWPEAAGVAGLLFLFTLGMFLHSLGVEAQRLLTDAASPGWDALAGPMLPLTALSKLSAIPFVPKWLLPALLVLPLLGWLGFGRRLGLFAFLWFLGFGTAVGLFARPENFYWVQLMLPLYLAGFAFAPRAIADLWHAIRAKNPQEPAKQS